MDARVVTVNLATAADIVVLRGARAEVRSGIAKKPVPQRVSTGADQLVGDSICDTKFHGGPDQAVYAYAGEDAAFWAAELDRPVEPGAFGENLTTAGVDVTGAVIGERWAIGSAVLEVSVPRIPCTVFQSFWDVPRLVKRFTAAGRPGAYLRIVEAGDIGAGDPVRITHRPAHGLTIGETFRAMTGDRTLAPRLLAAPELPESVRADARKWLA